jgi:hypothetical protein
MCFPEGRGRLDPQQYGFENIFLMGLGGCQRPSYRRLFGVFRVESGIREVPERSIFCSFLAKLGSGIVTNVPGI